MVACTESKTEPGNDVGLCLDKPKRTGPLRRIFLDLGGRSKLRQNEGSIRSVVDQTPAASTEADDTDRQSEEISKRQLEKRANAGRIVKGIPELPVSQYYAIRWTLALNSRQFDAARAITEEAVEAFSSFLCHRAIRRMPVERFLHPPRRMRPQEQAKLQDIADLLVQKEVFTVAQLANMNTQELKSIGLTEEQISMLAAAIFRIQRAVSDLRPHWPVDCCKGN